MGNPDILFRGIPRGATRGYTAEVIRAVKPNRVVIPCVGSFSLANTAVAAGVPPAQIMAGDISMYSTALGNAIMGHDWRLGVKSEEAEVVRPYLTDPISKAAAVLLMLRILQYANKLPTIHNLGLKRELTENAETYFQQLKAQVEDLATPLHGLDYRARDMWDTLEDHRNDPAAIILMNPPRYSGGYDRMFDGIDEALDWDPPAAVQFTENDYARLMDLLGDSAALTLMYYATPGEDPSPLWGAPWRAVFADKPRNKRVAAINWIIANADPLDTMITRPREWAIKAGFPLFKGQVEPESKLWAVRVRREVGEYYKDLLVHKLAGGLAERYVALLLDGHLLAIIGLNMKDWRGAGGKKDPERRNAGNLTFAFTVPHAGYKRLHKLTLLSVVSHWFWETVLAGEKGFDLLGAPAFVYSTMLTPYPENKTARGIMKLLDRERQPDGSYKLKYRAAVVDRGSVETIKLWLNKYGALTK